MTTNVESLFMKQDFTILVENTTINVESLFMKQDLTILVENTTIYPGTFNNK